MDVPLEIAGLNMFIPAIQGGSIIFLKGGIDPSKSYFVQLISVTAVQKGLKVHYVTSRGLEDINTTIRTTFHDGEKIDVIEEGSSIAWGSFLTPNSLLVIDSLSYLLLNKDISEVRHIIEELRKRCRRYGSILICVMDNDILDRKTEAVLLHMADGVLHFSNLETGEGLRRYIRIVTWRDGLTIDDNIFYSFVEGRINIDLRYRIT